MIREIFCLICLGAPTHLVEAAPWTQGDGEIYARTSLSWGALEDMRLWRGDFYAEYGVNEAWTLSLKGELVGLPDVADSTGQGWRVTARRRVLSVQGFLVSAEAGLIARAETGVRAGCDTTKIELRSGGAWSGRFATRPVYLFTEAAVRLHDSCPTHHFDLGIGFRLFDQVSMVSHIWIERGVRSADSNKLQSELMWHAENGDYSLAYQHEIGGAFEETALLLAVARRF